MLLIWCQKFVQRAFRNNPDAAKRTVAQLKGGSVYQYGHRENTAKQDEPDKWVIRKKVVTDIILGGLLDDLAWEFVARTSSPSGFDSFPYDERSECLQRKIMVL